MSDNQTPPQPDPALRRLDRLVGRWSMEGNLVGSDEKSIRGETTFRWLPGGFFLEQRARIDFMGQQIDALELIGYDPETDTFPSTVFSGFSPTPLPYRGDVWGDCVTRHCRPRPRRRRERERLLPGFTSSSTATWSSLANAAS